MTDNILGPDPREDSAERYDAKLTMTVVIQANLVTSNRDADEDEERIMDNIYKVLEAQGYTVHVQRTNLDR